MRIAVAVFFGVCLALLTADLLASRQVPTPDQVAANLEFYPCRDSAAPLVCADVMMITPNDNAKVCINDQDAAHCATVGELKTFEEARNAGQIMAPPAAPLPPCTVTVTVIAGVTHVATAGCS